MNFNLTELLTSIEKKLDWGESTLWQTRDFEELSERILNETGVSLSTSTLRRLWGRAAYRNDPSATTLDALAKFAGSENWRKFSRGIIPDEPLVSEAQKTSATAPKANWRPLRIFSGGVILLLGFWFALKWTKKVEAPLNEKFAFSSKPITRDIPNSVIFTYDATAAPTDSVFIQQSWNDATRTLVDKSASTFTSIYYEPGFYKAKLLVGNNLVKEHDLLIPTSGWLGYILQKPKPVYLDSAQFQHEGFLANATEQANGQAPVIFANVGNFAAIPVSSFEFEAEVKNTYSGGDAACRFVSIFLVTNDAPIIIGLSIPGCVSELNILAGKNFVSGKNTDLSGFGVDFSDWVRINCKAENGRLRFLIDGKQVYEAAAPKQDVKIVGLSLQFQGAGAARKLRLRNGRGTTFEAFYKR